jgi:hypothetical protein
MLKQLITLATLAVALLSAIDVKHARVPAQRGDDDKLIVGVFRTDGVIVPFARYANQKWTNPWQSPTEGGQVDGPNTIADLAKPWYESFVKPSAEWHLSLPAGGALTVRTSKNVQVCSHCQQVWGLLSDYPDAKPAEKKRVRANARNCSEQEENSTRDGTLNQQLV